MEQLKRRGSGVKKSVENFEAAIKADPNFAQAYGALAKALTFYPWFSGEVLDADSIIHTANRALALDSTLADAHSAIAMVYASSGKWDSAATEFQRAVEANPASFDVHFNYGRISTLRGDLPKAFEQFEKAKQLDSVSALVSAWISYAYFLNGKTDSALKESELAFWRDSTLIATTNLGALVYLGSGRVDSARRLITSQKPSNPMSTAAYGYAKLGETAKAWEIIRQLDSITPRPWSVEVQRASVLVATGDTAAALDALERSVARAGPLWVWVISPRDPAYEPVRRSARFLALVRQAGLDTAWVTAPR